MKTEKLPHWPRHALRLALVASGLAFASASYAAEAPPADQYVTRDEYNRLLKELEAIKGRLVTTGEKSATDQAANEETFNDYDRQLKAIKSLATTAQPGDTKMLFTGWADAGFANRKGAASDFNASFNPIMLWKLSDRLFFEGELEFEFEDRVTATSLEYANLSYIANDYLTLKAGRFLTPFGTYGEKLHPGWINKLPDAPLPFGHTGIAPTSSLGFQASGGFPVGETKFNYAVYVSNGPRLNMGASEPGEAGLLHFDNNPDNNGNKAVGARLGFQPVPELELGYSFKSARVGQGVDATALLQAVDLNYVRDAKPLRGVIDVKGQWVWSKVSDVIYDTGNGPFTFDNRRNGGYLQFAYRPSKLEDTFIRNLEGVVRWDRLTNPAGAPEETAFDEKRWTIGLNYWLGSSAAIKVAYQFGDRTTPGRSKESPSAFLLQTAMGF